MYYSNLHKQIAAYRDIAPATLAQLAPYVDQVGLIRVGGRLKHSTLDDNAKHSILLPQRCHLTELIIRTPQPFMADFPVSRVTANRPFYNVGMDYGGPFIVKESRRRGFRTQKAYLALFICMAVKAVHLEIVTDLSTESFLAAMDRFTSRRGIPANIYTDCGTNYVGSAKQIKALLKANNVRQAIASHIQCEWHFNPPAAPHFGSLWEAAIKSSKTQLKKVVGAQTYTIEEMTTLVIRSEGILNSRPLQSLSSDPNDLEALTPGHFLIGQLLLAIPDENVTETLQGRKKWFKQAENLAVGDLVVVHTPNHPPMSWQLGRISKVHPGPDGVIRVVTIRIADGLLKRPVVKVTKLPVEDERRRKIDAFGLILLFFIVLRPGFSIEFIRRITIVIRQIRTNR
ncbi:uncharacterized protein LOC112591908 [Melanaphis sacchari]|uniref:uncharacterized protein LOC112591908 n=1 Tax=Melanaphis sacchari TaxID=742174 RepID=UPI000DC12EDE|nr:uncharacterized protein LOC112591908 [Melanaphis sacchari]